MVRKVLRVIKMSDPEPPPLGHVPQSPPIPPGQPDNRVTNHSWLRTVGSPSSLGRAGARSHYCLILARRMGGWPGMGLIEPQNQKNCKPFYSFSFPKLKSSILFLPMRLMSLTRVVDRVTQDGTVSREDPKEKLETLVPWYGTLHSQTPFAEGFPQLQRL